VVAGLCAAIEAPLGPLAQGLRLRDVGRRDRLDELGFDIPLVGGALPTGRLDVADLADMLEAHLPADDPVARYAPSLRNPALSGALRGYLTGSLDLVLRLPDGRFVIADYKTNRLGPPGEALTGWHYRPEAVEDEMAAAHYPLQALLYSIALHRYLRWRLPHYDAATHLGGVLYLFVRGMSAVKADPAAGGAPLGAPLGSPLGVWSWSPPPAMVEALSDLFDRGAGT
jgi:exodeoxyribonuclease V beta subunit